MYHRRRNSCKLKVWRYTAHMFEPNEYLYIFPVLKEGEKIGEMEWNEILLNIISNGWIKQAYVQGFCFENIIFNFCKHV